MPNPKLVCSGWKNAHGVRFECGCVVDEGEPGGKTVMVQCEGCDRAERRSRQRAYWRGVEQVRRNSARGYKSDPEKAFEGIKYDAERS